MPTALTYTPTKPKPTYFISSNGSGSGSKGAPASISSMQTIIDRSTAGARFYLQGGLYEFPTGLTISKPGIEIIGSGGSDDASPDTKIYATTTYTSGWTLESGSIYSRTVSETPLAVYFDQQSAYNANLNATPIQLTVAGSPTSPGTNEWGFDAGTLYVNIGTDPASDTIRVTSSTTPIIQILQGAADVVIRGVEIGMVGSSGIIVAAAQDSTQRTATTILLEAVSIFGCYNQTTAAGAVTNNGITVQVPCKIEGYGVTIDLCENDGLSLKQGCYGYFDGLFISRCQDDGASPHYQAHLVMKNFMIRDVRTNASTDGNGVTVFEGSTCVMENGTIMTDAGGGVYITNSASDAKRFNHVTMTDVMVRTITPGTGTGVNGITLIGRGHLYCNRVDCSFWQSTTSGQGFAFRFSDGALSSGVTTMAHLKDCISQRCRAAISTAQENTANRMFIHVSNITMADNSVANVSNGGTAALTQSGTTTDTKSFYIS